jgi:hypothetical protein
VSRAARKLNGRFGRILAIAIVCAAFAAIGVGASGAVSPPPGAPVTHGPGPDSGPEKHHDRSQPLRSIPPSHTPGKSHPARPVPVGPHTSGPAAGNTSGPQRAAAPATIANFDGIGANGSAPPDNDVAAGPNQVVELVNTELAVYSKAGATLLAPEATNTLWSGFGGGCQNNNDGDATVLFDTMSQRWLVQQFSVSTTPYLECVAVSTSSDATGTWNRYSFQVTNFPDYPKMGVWPDAYYASYNQFNILNQFVGAEMCAFNRAAMLTGAASSQQCFTPSSAQTSVLPATLDGTTPPPSGEPEWFVGLSPTQANALAYWKFHVDWTTPANSTLTGPANLSVNAFAEACGGGTCVPQSGTRQKLDSLGDRLMFRLAYRNFGDHEAMVVSHSITAGTSVGMRWYELRPSGGSLSVFQQGTYAPDSTYRWMGSIAMDHAGDMGLGHSTSSSALHPGVAYTGRLATDAAGTMPQGETQMFTGAGSQNGGLSRWGDYSEMSVDPADDCTFWYANEYEPANGSFNWSTRIGSFKLSGCGSTGPSVTVSPSSVAAGGTVTVSWSGVTNPTTQDWIGMYHPGDPNTSYINWFWTSSCTQTVGSTARASGSCTFTMPNVAGTYELRLFPNNSYSLLTTSNQVTVTSSVSLTVSPSSVAGGGSVTVSWSGVTNPTTQDWIGLYHPGDPNSSFLNWFWTSSCTQTVGSTARASGSCTFTMPNVAGTYELRLFPNNSYTLLATSGQVTVTSGASLAVSPSSVTGGGSVTVSWSGMTNPTTQDWIGLYHPGDPNSSFINWFWTSSCTQTVGSTARASGSCTFTMPNVAGTYEFRLFPNNTYTLLTKSGSVTVG